MIHVSRAMIQMFGPGLAAWKSSLDAAQPICLTVLGHAVAEIYKHSAATGFERRLKHVVTLCNSSGRGGLACFVSSSETRPR
jgi:hypothetical protein